MVLPLADFAVHSSLTTRTTPDGARSVVATPRRPDRHRGDTAGPECILVRAATPGGGTDDPDHDEDHDDGHDGAGEDLVARHVVTCCPDGSIGCRRRFDDERKPFLARRRGPIRQPGSPNRDADRADHSSPTV